MRFLKTMWRPACASGALDGEAPAAVTVAGERIVLWRDARGLPAAIADRCVHMPLPLRTGRCVKGVLRCRHHGLEYDGAGRVVGVYSHAVEDPRRAYAYRAAEREGRVWVWMGEEADADEALLPPALLRRVIVAWSAREADA